MSNRRFLLPLYGLIPDELCVSGGHCTENLVSGPVKFPGGMGRMREILPSLSHSLNRKKQW